MDEPTRRFTSRPRPRGTRADAAAPDAYYLVKKVSLLRATYQIRLLAYLATIEGKALIIDVPRYARLAPSLEQLMRTIPDVLRVEWH